MKERPILFSGPMVRAILDGRKTQTRRVVKVPKHIKPDGLVPMTWESHDASLREQGVPDDARPYITGPRFEGAVLHGNLYGDVGYGVIKPRYEPGDRLWVRESGSIAQDKSAFMYADHGGTLAPTAPAGSEAWAREWKSCPSIHMPRWASRITLEVTGVRVERVRDISDSDAMAEGLIEWSDPPRVETKHYGVTRADVWETSPRGAFLRLFYDINKRASTDANPWVWVIEFRRSA